MDSVNYAPGLTALNLLTAAQRNASANGTGVDHSALEGQGLVVVDIEYVSGAPTADLKLQECDTQGGTYTDIAGAAITQVTTTGSGLQKISVNLAQAKQFIRAVLTLAGTSPVYGCSAVLLGQSKY